MKFRLLLFLMVTFVHTAASHAVPNDLKRNVPTLNEGVNVPILLYHRFGPTVADGMTITTPVFDPISDISGKTAIRLSPCVSWSIIT